jgi:hypothetical protein
MLRAASLERAGRVSWSASRRVIKWTVGDEAKWKCVQF